MPLPKINTPTYELSLPSNGKKIKYRPFLVREEKILIMALETENQKQITDAVVEILDACIMTRGIKVQNLATFDIEYIFLNVRSKSVGETINVNIICPDDEKTSVEVPIDLESIKVKKDKSHTNIVKIDDNLSLKLKYPSMEQFIENNFESTDETIKNTMKLITSSIDMIFSEEESWNASESTPKEFEEFIEQLNSKQFQTIEKFFDTMPRVRHEIEVTNPVTNVKSKVTLQGLNDFFESASPITA